MTLGLGTTGNSDGIDSVPEPHRVFRFPIQPNHRMLLQATARAVSVRLRHTA